IGLLTTGGRRIRYEWDARGRLAKITDSDLYVYEYSYNLSDCITEVRFPNGLLERFEYDALDRMVARSVMRPDGTLLTDRRFQYDGKSRLSGMQDLQRGSFDYRYDAQNHLADLIKDGALLEHYEYDGEDNLLLTRQREPVLLRFPRRGSRLGRDEYIHHHAERYRRRDLPSGDRGRLRPRDVKPPEVRPAPLYRQAP